MEKGIKVSYSKGRLDITEKDKWTSRLIPLNNATFLVDNIKPQAIAQFVVNDSGNVIKCIISQGTEAHWQKESEE